MTPVSARSRRRDERGFVLSSPLALLSAAAVVVAGVAFVSTGRPHQAIEVARPMTATTSASPTALPTSKAPTPVIEKRKRKAPAKPAIRRAATMVEVYNNSGIHGLADRTSRRASGAGWQVVGSDNWYGTISASTVYYPPRLASEARLLARDLGIHRLRPAIAPMRFDRLTVILTADYA
ncbi:MAG: LytR C-terminal domain-containing protein [Nocardioidaceae bacterium]